MTANWIDNQKNLMLFSGRAHPELAEQVAKELDIRVTPRRPRATSRTVRSSFDSKSRFAAPMRSSCRVIRHR